MDGEDWKVGLGVAQLALTGFVVWRQGRALREVELLKAELAAPAEVRKQVASAKVAAFLELHEYSYSTDEIHTSQNPAIVDEGDAVNWGLQFTALRRRCLPFITREDSEDLLVLCRDLENAVYDAPRDYDRLNRTRHPLTDFIRRQFEVATK